MIGQKKTNNSGIIPNKNVMTTIHTQNMVVIYLQVETQNSEMEKKNILPSNLQILIQSGSLHKLKKIKIVTNKFAFNTANFMIQTKKKTLNTGKILVEMEIKSSTTFSKLIKSGCKLLIILTKILSVLKNTLLFYNLLILKKK